MNERVIDASWLFLDAAYHGFDDEASTIVRALTPDDTNDVLWLYANLLKGFVLATEERRKLEPGVGLRMLRSQFTHPSGADPCA
jgi:hypothetical protein